DRLVPVPEHRQREPEQCAGRPARRGHLGLRHAGRSRRLRAPGPGVEGQPARWPDPPVRPAAGRDPSRAVDRAAQLGAEERLGVARGRPGRRRRQRVLRLRAHGLVPRDPVDRDDARRHVERRADDLDGVAELRRLRRRPRLDRAAVRRGGRCLHRQPRPGRPRQDLAAGPHGDQRRAVGRRRAGEPARAARARSLSHPSRSGRPGPPGRPSASEVVPDTRIAAIVQGPRALCAVDFSLNSALSVTDAIRKSNTEASGVVAMGTGSVEGTAAHRRAGRTSNRRAGRRVALALVLPVLAAACALPRPGAVPRGGAAVVASRWADGTPVFSSRDVTTWPFASTSPWNMPRGDGATFDGRQVASGGNINVSNGWGVTVGGADQPWVDQAHTLAYQEGHVSIVRADGVTAEEWYQYYNLGNPNR